MPRHDQITRQWKLLRAIEASSTGINIKDYALQNNLCERTTHRDLKALLYAGFPLYSDRIEHQTKWKLNQTLSSIPIRTSEILALHWIKQTTDAFEASVFGAALKELIDKLDATLSPALKKHAKALDNVFVADRFGPALSDEQQPLIAILSQACSDKTRVTIEYENSQGILSERNVDPYNICKKGSGRYLIAYCHKRNQIITFALWRIQNAERLNETFEIDPSYSYQHFENEHFRIMTDGKRQTIKIRFSPDAALYIKERTWHPTQKLENKPDGSVLLHMEVDGLIELASWVQSFGPRAKVIEPKALVDLVKKEQKEALAQYEEG